MFRLPRKRKCLNPQGAAAHTSVVASAALTRSAGAATQISSNELRIRNKSQDFGTGHDYIPQRMTDLQPDGSVLYM